MLTIFYFLRCFAWDGNFDLLSLPLSVSNHCILISLCSETKAMGKCALLKQGVRLKASLQRHNCQTLHDPRVKAKKTRPVHWRLHPLHPPVRTFQKEKFGEQFGIVVKNNKSCDRCETIWMTLWIFLAGQSLKIFTDGTSRFRRIHCWRKDAGELHILVWNRIRIWEPSHTPPPPYDKILRRTPLSLLS